MWQQRKSIFIESVRESAPNNFSFMQVHLYIHINVHIYHELTGISYGWERLRRKLEKTRNLSTFEANFVKLI